MSLFMFSIALIAAPGEDQSVRLNHSLREYVAARAAEFVSHAVNLGAAELRLQKVNLVGVAANYRIQRQHEQRQGNRQK